MNDKAVTPWQKVQSRALAVTPTEIDNYRSDHLDFLIASSMLAGNNSLKAISHDLDVPYKMIRDRLLDPVRCGWLSRELSKAVESRLGQVNAAVFHRAVQTGDPRAAKYLHTVYGKLEKKPQEHRHLHIGINLNNMSDEQIDKLIEQKRRALNLDDDT